MPSDAEKERCQKYRRMARAPRSPAEEAELAECVAEFRATHPSHAAALALFTISVKGLLRGKFEEFAQSELKLSKGHAHRIVRYGAFIDELCEADPTLLRTTERPPGAREPLVWPPPLRLPIDEEEARLFAATGLGKEARLRAWRRAVGEGFATKQSQVRKIRKERAKAIIERVTQPPAQHPSPMLAPAKPQQSAACQRFLIGALVGSAMMSAWFLTGGDHIEFRLVGLIAALVLAVATGRLYPRTFRHLGLRKSRDRER